MKNKRLLLFAKTEIFLSLISAIITAFVLTLLTLEVIRIPNEESDLGTGIAIVITVIFFIVFGICQGAACILMIAEANAIKKGVDKNIFRKKLLLIGALIKIILACASVYIIILCFSVSFWFGGFAAVFFAAILLALAAFGFVCYGIQA